MIFTGKIVNFSSKATKEKHYTEPHGRYILSEASKIIYLQNYEACLRLYLIRPEDYPTMKELEAMPVYHARKIMKQLNTLYDEKADERSKKLTGKSLIEHAANKLDMMFKDIDKT